MSDIKREGRKLQQGHKLKKKKRHLEEEEEEEESEGRNEFQRFFEEEASEDSEEDEVSAENEEENRLVQRALIELKPREVPEMLHIPEEQVEEHYQKKVREERRQEETNFITPSIKDPSIYALEVVRGKESDLVMQILNKANYRSKTREADTPTISSAAYFAKHPGVIFIESFTMTALKESIDGFSGILTRRPELVKIEHYNEFFTAKEQKKEHIEPKSFVRVKQGLYENDLARVVRVDKGKVVLEVVPRIDVEQFRSIYEELKEKKDEREKHRLEEKLAGLLNYTQRRIGGRPEQKLLFEKDIADIANFRRLKFSDSGLHEISLRISSITVFSKESLKFSEIKYFSDKNSAADFLNSDVKISLMTQFERGEKVIVTSGVYERVKGVIENIDEGGTVGKGAKILIRPKDKTISPFQVSPNELSKYFKERDHVKVVGGRYAGKTGIILSIKDNSATLLTDNSNQITVLVNELTISSEQKFDSMENNTFQKYDLVKLSGGLGPACVLMSQRDSLKVLDQHNTTKLINILEVQQKLDTRNNFAKNNFGQQIRKGTVVRIKEGLRTGKKCEVRHAFKDVLFLYNPEFYATSAIVAEQCTNVTVISSSYIQSAPPRPALARAKKGGEDEQKQQQQQESRSKSKKVNAEDQQFQLGKTVVVQSGEWKGYQGVIKGVGKETVSVKLNAKMKVVMVKKSDIKSGGGMGDYGKTPRPMGGQTVFRHSPGPGQTPSRTLD